MASINYNRNFRLALKIDEAFLGRMNGLMADFLPGCPIQFSLETYGQLTVTTNNLTELLSSEIVQTDVIKSIEMKISDYSGGETKRISFKAEKDEAWRTCSVQIEAPVADKVMAYKARMENLIRSARIWYSFFRPNNYGASMLVAFAFGSACLLLIMFLLIQLKLMSSDSSLSLAITFVFDVAGVAMVLVFLTKKIFPSVVFYIGISKRAADSIVTIRSILFVVIGLGLGVSILGNIIYEMTKHSQ